MTTPDPKISKIIEQASRIKTRERRAAEKEERRDAPKPVPALNIESLRAYRALYPHPPTVIWMFGFIAALAGFIAALMEDLFPNDRLIFGGLAALLGVYALIKGHVVPVFWYFLHRGWRTRLPFTLNGWAEFASTAHILDSWEWRDLSIKIDATTTNPAFNAALDAIITILKKDVANVMYEEDVGEPSRHEWNWDAKKRIVTGSANSQVLGLLMNFFRDPLSQVVKSTRANITVTIAPDGDWYHVTGKPMGQVV